MFWFVKYHAKGITNTLHVHWLPQLGCRCWAFVWKIVDAKLLLLSEQLKGSTMYLYKVQCIYIALYKNTMYKIL